MVPTVDHEGGRPSGASAMIITTLGNRHLSMVEPFTITGLAEKQHLVISFIDVRVYSLATVE